MNAALLALTCLLPAQTPDAGIKVQETEEYVQIDTDAIQAKIRKKGYVSGVAAGSLLDKKTGARDLGFGLHIMDFLLGPGWKDDDYTRDKKYHGDLPKHYIEGPQICTQAKELKPEIVRGKDFVAVKLAFRFTMGHNGYTPGSLWEQTLVFQPGKRYVVCSERITCANDVDNLLYRIDMPGHVKHKNGDTFNQVYLSYHGTIPAAEFAKDFAPDDRFLYQRKDKTPARMIRGYQVNVNGKPGPWLAGMTLDPSAVVEAWCHQRGYICFIQELHGKRVKKGESIGAAYIVGYFDGIPDMETTYDKHKGADRIVLKDNAFRLEASPAANARYEFRKDHDPYGTGKFYMGREIALVMSHLGAGWLERPEREKEEHVSKLLPPLKIKPGDVVADIGAGSGYYTMKLAEIVGPKGKVYAVDIQPEMLAIIEKRKKAAKANQVELVKNTETELKLPADSVDLMLLVDVYHEFSHPYEMMEEMTRALKPGGRAVFVEFRKEDDKVPILDVHRMTEKQVLREAAPHALKHVTTMGHLPWQHVVIFEKVESPKAKVERSK